jgi:hypothetical protein
MSLKVPVNADQEVIDRKSRADGGAFNPINDAYFDVFGGIVVTLQHTGSRSLQLFLFGTALGTEIIHDIYSQSTRRWR